MDDSWLTLKHLQYITKVVFFSLSTVCRSRTPILHEKGKIVEAKKYVIDSGSFQTNGIKMTLQRKESMHKICDRIAAQLRKHDHTSTKVVFLYEIEIACLAVREAKGVAV